MSNGKRLQQVFGLALVVLLLGGCAGAQAVPTETQVPPTAPPTPTSVPPTATPTQTPAPPTATPLPPPTATAIPEPLTAATVIASEGEMSWDFVALGTSMFMGSVNKYANHIEADLGVEVTVHNWCRGGQSSKMLLYLLRNDEELRSDISEAEVVVFRVPLTGIDEAVMAYGSGECGGPDNEDCLREHLRMYEGNTDAIIAEILSMRSTDDTIIRTMTGHSPHVNQYKEEGHFEGLHPYWLALNEYVVQAASAHSVPVARVYQAFNGPNGDEDFEDKGYADIDGFHPNKAGFDLQAELLRGLGYQPLAP